MTKSAANASFSGGFQAKKPHAKSLLLSLLVSAALSACGGGGISGSSTGSDGTTTGDSSGGTSGGGSTTTGATTGTTGGGTSGGGTVVSVASLSVIASSSQLNSAAATTAAGVTITAIAKDANNNLLAGVAVAFSASAGAIEVTQGTTDASGSAQAVLTTSGDNTNQSIVVTATATGATNAITIAESGTAVSISGPAVVGSGANATFVVKLADSSGAALSNRAVTLISSLGNVITPATITTNAAGQGTFTYTGTVGGNDVLTSSATSVNATNTLAVSVSATRVVFETPAPNVVVPFGKQQVVTVQYTSNSAPVSGAVVNFSTTRGTLNGASLTATTVTTSATGEASATLQSSGAGGAGGAIVSAQIGTNGPSATLPLDLVATTPSAIAVQASPSTVPVNGTSVITAVVRDANDNLVADTLVDFTLKDTTSGTLSSASATTNDEGSAAIVYTAGSVNSANNGVQIGATVNATSITATPALITVGGQALRITLGTGNTVQVLDDTRYQLPYTAIVTDSAGNAPPAGTQFSLSVQSVAYQKGNYGPFANSMWPIQYAVASTDTDIDSTGFGCANEDVNLNGILDPGEDYNGNGLLDPGNVATVPTTSTLDTTGSTQFLITYPKDRGGWVKVRLTAIATVSGTETTANALFVLPLLAADVTNSEVEPPGFVSPYGVATTCKNPN